MTGPSTAEVEDVALRVASALEKLGLRYLVGGSVASSLLGEPRATKSTPPAFGGSWPRRGSSSAHCRNRVRSRSGSTRDSMNAT
jgi:hypothetical protein